MLPLAIIMAFLAGVGVTVFALRGPIPLFEKGSRIFAVRDEQALKAVTKVLGSFGLRPRRLLQSIQVKRALMDDNTTLISYTEQSLQQAMGNPAAGLAIRVKNPEEAATKAASLLKGAGYDSQVLGELDSTVPSGAMVFVKTDAFCGTILVFRRHFFRMGKMPPRWR